MGAGHSAQQHHEEEGDEGWLVSYADMVTLLFGFFVILYSLSKVDEKKYEEHSRKIMEAFTGKNSDQKTEVTAQFSTEFRQQRAFKLLVESLALGEMDQAVKKIEQLAKADGGMQALKHKLDPKAKENLEFMKSLTPGAGDESRYFELVLPDVSLFAPGQADVLPPARLKLLSLANEIKQVAELGQIEVEGHTDSTPPGAGAKYANNWTLSSARAGAVAQILLEAGIKSELLAVKGLGHLRPLIPEVASLSPSALKGARDKNRRVHIVLKRKVAREASAKTK